MAQFDLSIIDRYSVNYRRAGTSIFVEVIDSLANTVVESKEFTGAIPGAPIPNEIVTYGRGRINSLIGGDNSLGGSLKVNTIGLFKQWSSAGSDTNSRVGETASFKGTYFHKLQMEAMPKRVRLILTQKSYTPALAYTQTGKQVVVSYTGSAIAVGDKVSVSSTTQTTGALVGGWYVITAVSAGVSVTYTADDSQSATGSMNMAHLSKNWKACVAMTEQGLNDTVTNACVPRVNATSFNVLADATNPYGFRLFDFNTDNTKNPNYLGNIPSGNMLASSQFGQSFIASNWVELPDVAPLSGTKPYMLVRAYHDASVDGDFSSVSGSFLGNYMNPAYDSSGITSSNYFRPIYAQLNSTGGIDSVTTLTSLPASVSLNGGGLFFALEVDYGVPTVSVATFGDSTWQGNKYFSDTTGTLTNGPMAGWAIQAVLGKSTPAAPYQLYNGGMSAHTTKAYLIQQLNAMLDAGIVPNVAILQCYSVNDSGTPDVYKLAANRKELLKGIKRLRDAGCAKILVPTWPSTAALSNTPALQALMNAYNAEIKSWATSKVTDGCPDFEAIRVSMTNAYFFSPDGITTYPTLGDGIHDGRMANIARRDEILKFI